MINASSGVHDLWRSLHFFPFDINSLIHPTRMGVEMSLNGEALTIVMWKISIKIFFFSEKFNIIMSYVTCSGHVLETELFFRPSVDFVSRLIYFSSHLPKCAICSQRSDGCLKNYGVEIKWRDRERGIWKPMCCTETKEHHRLLWKQA